MVNIVFVVIMAVGQDIIHIMAFAANPAGIQGATVATHVTIAMMVVYIPHRTVESSADMPFAILFIGHSPVIP